MSQKDKNLRVRRTQKLLCDALIELIEEQSFGKITVIELSERAMISRAAFYRNYQDKYDLVEQIFAEAMATLFEDVSQSGTEHPPKVWVDFFDHVAQHDRLYRALLGQNGSQWFVSKMRTTVFQLIKQYQQLPHWQSVENQAIYPESDEFVPHMLATMFVEAITWWLEQGRSYSSQEMAERCILLASAIFKETSTWK